MQILSTAKLNSFDICYNLAKYDELCMIEFINFGTQRTTNLFKIIGTGQEIIIIEKYLAKSFNNYILMALDDIENPNTYLIQNILISILNLINHFANLYYSNEKYIESAANKQKYIVGFIMNFVNKFMNQNSLDNNSLKNILNKSNGFSFNSFANLKTFINLFRTDFSGNSFEKFNNLINILEN